MYTCTCTNPISTCFGQKNAAEQVSDLYSIQPCICDYNRQTQDPLNIKHSMLQCLIGQCVTVGIDLLIKM